MLHINMRCVLSELMLHIHPNVCCTRKAVLCRKCVMSKPVLCHTREYDVASLMSEHMLHMNRRLFSIRTNVRMLQENMMSSVRTYVAY